VDIVVDANVGVWAVLPVAAGVDAVQKFASWRQGGRRIVAPPLWLAECVSAVRQIVADGVIDEQTARIAVEDILALDVELVPVGRDECLRALAWAGALGQRNAYDAFYLAVAERLNAELWTADRRLANAAHGLGAAWVHWIGESDEL